MTTTALRSSLADDLYALALALRTGLGGESSDYNRLWNMTLLNLLQRAGALVVHTIEETEHQAFMWCAEVMDTRILEITPRGEEVLRGIFSLRKEEQRAARGDVDRLIAVLSDETDWCRLGTLFQAVEAGDPAVAECGRCDWCRHYNVSPPSRVPFKGLAESWAEPPPLGRTRLPTGITVIHPSDGDDDRSLHRMLTRLAAAGIEQYVVPAGLGEQVAHRLSTMAVRAGFVLEDRHLLDGSGWAMVNLPTAVLLAQAPRQLDTLYRRFEDWSSAHPSQPLLLIAPAGLVLRGRPLEQIASRLAPYGEDILDNWTLY